MYTQDDLERISSRAKKQTLISVLLLALGVAVAVWALIVRQKLAGTIGLALLAMAAYGFYALCAAPWQRYRRFLSDVLTGRSHDTWGLFESAQEDKHTTEDGVLVRDVLIRAQDADKGPKTAEAQVYYWDAGYPFGALRPGAKVKIRAFGRYILSIEEAA